MLWFLLEKKKYNQHFPDDDGKRSSCDPKISYWVCSAAIKTQSMKSGQDRWNDRYMYIIRFIYLCPRNKEHHIWVGCQSPTP